LQRLLNGWRIFPVNRRFAPNNSDTALKKIIEERKMDLQECWRNLQANLQKNAKPMSRICPDKIIRNYRDD